MKKEINKEELFERMPVMKAIFTLTIPVIITSIISIIYNLSDTYFVGILNDPVQNAAVTLVAPAMMLFYGITNLFGIGGSSLMSRKLGTKEYDKVEKASATAIYFGLLFSILLSAITLIFNKQILHILGSSEETYAITKQYLFWTVGVGAVPGIMNILVSFLLRAEGRSVQASIGAVSGCVLNIILDPFFILPFGLNLGAAGAGLATFIANCCAFLYYIILLFRLKGKTYVSINPKHFSLEPEISKNIFVVGIPGVFQNVLNVVGMTLLNNIAVGFGTDAIASMGIVSKINQIPVQVIFGFSQGVMPLIGYNYASKNYPRMKEIIKKTFAITLTCLTIIVILNIAFGQYIVRIFMDNDNIVTIGAKFLSGSALGLPFMCIDFIVVGISQSFGIGKCALIFSFLRKAFLEIPFQFIFSAIFGLYGLAYTQLAGEFVMAVIAIFVLKHLMAKTQSPKMESKSSE